AAPAPPAPPPLAAEQVRPGDPAFLEHGLAGGRALDTHLRLDARQLEARRVRLDEERGDPGMPRLRIRLREPGVELRDARVRDEPLRSVQDVLVALEPRGRAHRRGV